MKLVLALASLLVLSACERHPVLTPLSPAQLDRPQAEALQRMNAAGANSFAGWTWRYEIGAGCWLRVIKRYEGRPIPVIEHQLQDHEPNIVPYAGSGFGVKARPRGEGGSIDLLDTRTEAQAVAFAGDVAQLLTVCSRDASAKR